MTPELRAALEEIVCIRFGASFGVIDAIAPIVDAAITDAAVAECERGIRQRKVDVHDALLAAADDLRHLAASRPVTLDVGTVNYCAKRVAARATGGNAP